MNEAQVQNLIIDTEVQRDDLTAASTRLAGSLALFDA